MCVQNPAERSGMFVECLWNVRNVRGMFMECPFFKNWNVLEGFGMFRNVLECFGMSLESFVTFQNYGMCVHKKIRFTPLNENTQKIDRYCHIRSD